MKLKELLLDWIENTELFEMAIRRREARRFVAHMGSPIVEQFLKLTYLNSPRDYRHWLDDGLNNYLYQLREMILKESNRRPEPEDYYIWLFDDLYTLNESNVFGRMRWLTKHKYVGVPIKKPFNATEAVLDIQHLFNPKTSKLLIDISTGDFENITNYHTFQ